MDFPPHEDGFLRKLRLAELSERVRNVEPEVGPGGLFKIAFLGSRDFPLCEDEYRRRYGSKFTEDVPAVKVGNPLTAKGCIRVEFRRVAAHVPDIVVRLRPGRLAWLPLLDGFRLDLFDEVANPRSTPP